MMQQLEPADATRNRWLWALAVAFVAFVPRVMRAWESREEILVRSTWDDTYYYFGIARNIMHGHAASFDGENVTNGFHPLWLALITPLWAFDGDTPIHLALTLGAIFGAVTAAAIFQWLIEATGNTAAALIGAGFFALHPAAVSDSANGLESSVAVMILALSMLALQRLDFADSTTRIHRSDVVLGVALGLLMLARTDMIFCVVAMLLYFTARAGWKGIARPVVAGAVAGVCVIPWLVWSYVATRSIMQISGRAGGVLVRQQFEEQHGAGIEPKLRHGADFIWQLLKADLPHSYFIPGSLPGWPALAGGVLIVTFVGWTATKTHGRYSEAAMALAVVGAGLFVMLSYHAGMRFFTRAWYFTPMALVGALALGLVLDAATRFVDQRLPVGRRESARLALHAAVVAFFVIVYQPYDAMGWTGTHPHELNAYAGARWLGDNTPKETRAGSFNGGIIGYFSDRAVLNLDGVVNENAYEALKSCTMTEYVRDEGIDYIVDFGAVLLVASCGPSVVTYEPIAILGDSSASYGAVVVNRVVQQPQ